MEVISSSEEAVGFSAWRDLHMSIFFGAARCARSLRTTSNWTWWDGQELDVLLGRVRGKPCAWLSMIIQVVVDHVGFRIDFYILLLFYHHDHYVTLNDSKLQKALIFYGNGSLHLLHHEVLLDQVEWKACMGPLVPQSWPTIFWQSI